MRLLASIVACLVALTHSPVLSSSNPPLKAVQHDTSTAYETPKNAITLIESSIRRILSAWEQSNFDADAWRDTPTVYSTQPRVTQSSLAIQDELITYTFQFDDIRVSDSAITRIHTWFDALAVRGKVKVTWVSFQLGSMREAGTSGDHSRPYALGEESGFWSLTIRPISAGSEKMGKIVDVQLLFKNPYNGFWGGKPYT